MKLCCAIWVAIACLALPVSAAIADEPGMLDEGFGSHGRVTTPIGLPAPWSQTDVQLAGTPEGGAYVAAGTHLLAYLPDGAQDPSFGNGGSVSLTGPPGSRRFELSDLAVDPEGRILVFGSAVPEGAPASRHSLAAVLRYLPDGTLDPSFGDDGVAVGAFGLRARPGSTAVAVTGSRGAVDAQGRITLVVGTMERIASCGGPARVQERDRVVAQLSPSGQLESSFGNHGVQRISPLQSVTSMSLGEDSEAMLAGPLATKCGARPEFGVISLRTNGSRRGFGQHGTQRLTGAVAAIAVDRVGRTVVLCKESRGKARDEHSTKVLRLLPDGELDPAFSGGWISYTFQGPLYDWSSLAIDSHDRPVMVGTLVKPLQEEGSTRFHRWMIAVPLRDDGLMKSNFGWQGWLALTRFDPHSDVAASEALVDPQGRLLIAGTTRRPELAPHGGLALARFGLY